MKPYKYLFFLITMNCILAIGCGKSIETEFNNLINKTKNQQTPSNFPALISAMIATNKNGNYNVDSLPKDITSLPLFQPNLSALDINPVINSRGQQVGISFITGSGFGHWGLIVYTNKTSTLGVSNLYGRVKPWNSEVFFWLEKP